MLGMMLVFFFKQKTAYEMRISDWSSDVCSSDLAEVGEVVLGGFKAMSQGWASPKRLMVYCHGGLNDEKASASRIASMLPYLLANEIYPLHFMWEIGRASCRERVCQYV